MNAPKIMVIASLLSGCLLALVPDPSSAAGISQALFSTFNSYGVVNGGKSPLFVTNVPVYIDSIMTYHWNNGQGTQTPGNIVLRSAESDKVLGSWSATGQLGQGGVPNAYWNVATDIELPAGRYEVVDSNPSTWAQNSNTRGRGMVEIKGCALVQSDTKTPAACISN